MKADDPTFQSFSKVMTDEALGPQERGQKLIDLYKDTIKGAQDASAVAWDNLVKGWGDQVKADQEIGGAKFAQTKIAISKTIDLMGPHAASFREALEITGMGNHPAVWRGLNALAQLVTEGGHVAGQPPSPKANDLKAFFPNSKMS